MSVETFCTKAKKVEGSSYVGFVYVMCLSGSLMFACFRMFIFGPGHDWSLTMCFFLFTNVQFSVVGN